MTILESLEQKLKAEIESHQRTKIEFEKYRMDHAFHEYENGSRTVQIFVNKITAENKYLKSQLEKVNDELRELKSMMLPSPVSISGVSRRYDFRRQK